MTKSEIKTAVVNVVDKFLDLVRESVIVQSVLSLGVAGVIGYMTCTGQGDQLSKEFWLIAGTVFGFWFRAKNDMELRTLTKIINGKSK